MSNGRFWNPAEAAAWELPAALTISEWADRFRVLDVRTSAEPGPWRTARVPYLREVMDAFRAPEVERITILKATQAGGTEALLNMLGWAVCEDPGPAMWVLPRDVDLASFAGDRLGPMIEGTAALRDRVLSDGDALTNEWARFDRMTLYLSGARSPAALAARPVRYLFRDETDKYPRYSGEDADPVALTSERTKTFYNRKEVEASSPTTRRGYIAQAFEESDRRRFRVPCAACGFYQVLTLPRVKWPEDVRDPQAIRAGGLAWYECERCGARWDDPARRVSVARGVWVPDPVALGPDGRPAEPIPAVAHRGYWFSALYTPWTSLSDVAAKFLGAKSDPRKLMAFVNGWLAEVWEEKLEEPKPELLAARCSDYAAGVVPHGGLLLTAGADIQADCAYLVIRAWGYGEASWLVRASRVESLEELVVALFRTTYARADGTAPMAVRLAAVDSGHRTPEIYALCRAWHPRARPIKGHDNLSGLPYKLARLERTVGGQAVGLALYHLDVSYYKDRLARFISAGPQDPAQWHLPAEPGADYLAHLCAERKVTERNRKTGAAREVWQPAPGKPPNHYLDCEVYATAAADMLRVSALRRPGETAEYRAPDSPGPRRSARDEGRGGWLGRGGDWGVRGGGTWLGRR